MQNRILIAALIALAPGVTLAQNVTSHQCTYGELSRRVVIVSEPGLTVPCEVHYYKDTEAPGEDQVLWSATAEEGYCEARVDEFLARLAGWGWDCGTSAPAVDDATDEVMDVATDDAVDDTEALAPGDSEEEDGNES